LDLLNTILSKAPILTPESLSYTEHLHSHLSVSATESNSQFIAVKDSKEMNWWKPAVKGLRYAGFGGRASLEKEQHILSTS